MPLSRRELIRSGLLIPAVGGLIGARPVAAAANAIWVIDNEMPDADAVAAEAETARATVYSFSSDPGQLWMNVLAPRLRIAPVAVGGYTSAATLFCLHYLARDRNLALAAFGPGSSAPTTNLCTGAGPIDLRDPGFADPRAACTWLMLPRRA